MAAVVDTVRPASASFEAIGSVHRIAVTQHDHLPAAVAVARRHLADLDRAVSRFRPDSEVSALARLAEHGRASVPASPVFVSYLRAALRVARLTDGLVDPTVGRAVAASGYDADLAVVRLRSGAGDPDLTDVVPGWTRVSVSDDGWVGVPARTLLDLGASAKAHAADTIAALLARDLPGGFLVDLGGDIATSGAVPPGGWWIGVELADGSVAQVVVGRGQGFATSSTQLRTWQVGGRDRHHLVDPRTGRTALTPWAQVTCAGASALEANAASTAAVLLGADAPAWLSSHGIPARLDAVDGTVVRTPGWPS
jgi:thiamine biosynthesis lipoprotein